MQNKSERGGDAAVLFSSSCSFDDITALMNYYYAI